VHGQFKLPPEYAFALVPSNAKFCDDIASDDKSLWEPTKISSIYSPSKVLISIVQLLFAVATIYRARGDQISRFGYAAFGLTVIPYALMSLVNLLANLSCPQYPNLYMVRTELMQHILDTFPETEARFTGIVGTVDENPADDTRDQKPAQQWTLPLFLKRVAWLPIALLPMAATAVIIWGLTHWMPGTDSTSTQRIAVILWLALGGWIGAMGDRFSLRVSDEKMKQTKKARLLYMCFGCFWLSTQAAWCYGQSLL